MSIRSASLCGFAMLALSVPGLAVAAATPQQSSGATSSTSGSTNGVSTGVGNAGSFGIGSGTANGTGNGTATATATSNGIQEANTTSISGTNIKTVSTVDLQQTATNNQVTYNAGANPGASPLPTGSIQVSGGSFANAAGVLANGWNSGPASNVAATNSIAVNGGISH